MYIIIIILYFLSQVIADIEEIKWCLISDAEFAKCNQMQKAISMVNMSQFYTLTCVQTDSYIDCMDKIKDHKADLINVDVGLAYYGVLNYQLRAIGVENYNNETEPLLMKLSYTANVVVPKNSITHPNQLIGQSACFSGVGSAEGWIYPLSKIIEANLMPIAKCNSIVEIVSAFFSNGTCIPGNRDSVFNPFGENGELPCSQCSSKNDYRGFCSNSDQFSGSPGALKCLERNFNLSQITAAFVKGNVITNMIRNGDILPNEFELLCFDKQTDGTYNAPLENIEQCNWGRPQSKMLMTRLSSRQISSYQTFIELLQDNFGINGKNKDYLQIFQSSPIYELSHDLQIMLVQSGENYPRQLPYDLMFSDNAQSIYFPQNREIINFFDFINDPFKKAVSIVNQCSMPGVTWCAPDMDIMEKCSRMKIALETINVQPPFHCLYGESITNCMNLVSDGFADLMTLDAAELFIGGKYMNMVPIAIEYYGDSTDYYGVAVVKEMDKGILISNWYNLKTCHGAAGRAVGWVLPITVALNTQQMVIRDKNIVQSFGQLVSRACIPGILDDEFNPNKRNPINLCEICSAGGADLCMASSVESQFTESGAFVCLLEMGDIAFVKHYTVYDNTEGRNTVDWARNKKMDDYELLCMDGTRKPISQWKDCNIGKVPGSTVVTGSFKTIQQRETMWSLLRHAQDHYSADGNSFFSMFESTFNRYDLMFSDAAISLKPIPFANQTYQDVLGQSFIRQCETLENLSKPGYSGFYIKPNL